MSKETFVERIFSNEYFIECCECFIQVYRLRATVKIDPMHRKDRIREVATWNEHNPCCNLLFQDRRSAVSYGPKLKSPVEVLLTLHISLQSADVVGIQYIHVSLNQLILPRDAL